MDKPTRTNIFPDKPTKDLNSSLEKLDRHLRQGAKVSNMSIVTQKSRVNNHNNTEQ